MGQGQMSKCQSKPQYDFLFDDRQIVIIMLSLTIYKIFANEIKWKKCNLENKGQGDETCAIGLEMFDSILYIFQKIIHLEETYLGPK